MTRRPMVEARLYYPVDTRGQIVFAAPALQPTLLPVYQTASITATRGTHVRALLTSQLWIAPPLTPVATPLASDPYGVVRAVVKAAVTTKPVRAAAWVDATGITAAAIAVQLGWSTIVRGTPEPDVRRVQTTAATLVSLGVLCVRDGAYSTPQIVAAADESPSDAPTGSTQLALF